MAGNGDAIIALDLKRMQAMAAKDYATLESVIGDDLVYTHSSARLDTKRSLIDNMKSGSTVYTSVTPKDVKTEILFKQADFIKVSIDNVTRVLVEALIVVAIV